VMPDDRLLIFRISNWGVADAMVSLFDSKEQWQQMIKCLDAEPLDAISVSCMNYNDRMIGTDNNMAQLTREVTDKPIIICGSIYDRATADEALKDADIVLSGKSLLLNSDWVADIRDNKPLELRIGAEADVAYTEEALP
jgi:2,4-dienoyl-CoA reductase-like NADH-dependent reductase (Old Yellow Enzyme family)